jgi:hypothetical protein
MSIRVLKHDELPWSVIAREFIGADHGGVGVSLRQIDIHLSPSFSTEWLAKRES